MERIQEINALVQTGEMWLTNLKNIRHVAKTLNWCDTSGDLEGQWNKDKVKHVYSLFANGDSHMNHQLYKDREKGHFKTTKALLTVLGVMLEKKDLLRYWDAVYILNVSSTSWQWCAGGNQNQSSESALVQWTAGEKSSRPTKTREKRREERNEDRTGLKNAELPSALTGMMIKVEVARDKHVC